MWREKGELHVGRFSYSKLIDQKSVELSFMESVAFFFVLKATSFGNTSPGDDSMQGIV